MSAIVLDTETTGFSPKDDRVVELAIVSYETEEVLFHSLINPERHIPDEVVKVHGITNDRVKDSPPFRDVAQVIAKIISDAEAVIGHNPFYDRGMLGGEFRRCELSVRWPVLICTKMLWDKHEPREERHLQNAYKRFVSRAGFDGAHGALADTIACMKVVRAQLTEFDLHHIPWNDHDPDQKVWWGPSNHVIWRDGVLVFNVGKNKGIPCHEIEKSFWRWLVQKDFPEHVKTLADYLTIVKPEINGQDLATWAMRRDL